MILPEGCEYHIFGPGLMLWRSNPDDPWKTWGELSAFIQKISDAYRQLPDDLKQ